MLGSQEKILEPKVNVKFFTVDPYTPCNRVSRPFPIWSIWQIWPLLGQKNTFFIDQFEGLCSKANSVKFYGPKWLVQVSHTQYYIFYVQLAPIGGILGPLKSVFGRFGPIRQIYPLFLILEGVAISAMIGYSDKSQKIRWS